ncbi:hypothetical protein [Nocardia anaemiae]|uniref:hypothetical protein n=1 Tax=Nocardia anaemiae TaxID=263910 RepID=UPI0007A45AD7|nr:hypothetical protein [Nocardia anaemiae]
MNADLMGLGVAVVGVLGTVSGAALTQLAALRGKRVDAEIQRLQRKDERQEAASLATQEQKQALYAELNTAARRYRTIVRDHLADLQRDSTIPIPEQLEPMRSTYGDLFSKAQMVLPESALAVAVVLNDCLGQGYSALRALYGTDSPATVDELFQWFDGPVSAGVWLQRRALRTDLGVEAHDPEVERRLQQLEQDRVAQFGSSVPVAD